MSIVSDLSGKPVIVEPAAHGATCELHTWPTNGLGQVLFAAMNANGGVNACPACIKRAHTDASVAAAFSRLKKVSR